MPETSFRLLAGLDPALPLQYTGWLREDLTLTARRMPKHLLKLVRLLESGAADPSGKARG